MVIITGYLVPETFEPAMTYIDRILVQSLKLKSLSTVSQIYYIDYMNLEMKRFTNLSPTLIT